MTSDRVSLSEGYEGALQQNKNIAEEGDHAHGLSKKQHNHTAELLGQNKGALAGQAGNGSTATANNLSAGALMHTNNASGGVDYIRRTGGHEDAGAQDMASHSNAAETAASDLTHKINRG